MTDHAKNPFHNPNLEEVDLPPAKHLSDDPGRDYSEHQAADRDRHPSSGPSGPSGPRRPGANERQAPRRKAPRPGVPLEPLIPGEVLLADGDIDINIGLEVTRVRVENRADRPVQVGSHFHFAEVNSGLEFDRDAAWGRRLNILSGGSMRFEPGAAEDVELVPIRGERLVFGLRGLCGGKLDGQD